MDSREFLFLRGAATVLAFAASLLSPSAVAEILFPLEPLSIATRENGLNLAFVTSGSTDRLTILSGTLSYSLTTISVGERPRFLTVSPATGRAYLSDTDTDTVYDVNGATASIAATVTTGIGDQPGPISVTSNSVVVVSNMGASTVSTFDEGDSMATARASGKSPWRSAVYDAVGSDFVYVINRTDRSITRFDDQSWAAVTLDLSDTAGDLFDIAVSQDTQTVYVTDIAKNQLYMINGATMTLSQTEEVCGRPVAVRVNDSRDRVYLLCETAGAIITFGQGTPHEVGNRIDLLEDEPGFFELFDDGSVADADQLYVGSRSSRSMAIIDDPDTGDPLDMMASVTRVTLPAPATGFAVRPGSQVSNVRVFVSHTPSGRISIVTPTLPTPATSTIQYPGRGEEIRYFETGLQRKLIVSHPDTDQLSITDLASLNALSLGSFCAGGSTCTEPTHLELMTSLDRLVVTFRGSDRVSIVRPSTNSLLATLSVGTYPFAAAADSAVSRAYVLNRGSPGGTGSVSVLNLATNTVARTDSVGTNPRAIGVNPGTRKIYVANANDDTVSIINDQTAVVTNVAVEDRPVSLAVDTVNNRTFVGHAGAEEISIISNADAVGGSIDLDLSPGPILVDGSRNLLYVLSATTREVLVVDISAAPYPVLRRHSLPQVPRSLLLDPVTDVVYMPLFRSRTFRSIYPTNFGLGQMRVAHLPYRLAVDTTTTPASLYSLSASAQAIDEAFGTVTTLAELDSTESPLTFVSRADDRVYVAGRTSGQVSVLNTSAVPPALPTLVTQLSVCDMPVALANDPTGNRVFAACQGSDQVAVISTLTNAISSFIPVGIRPHALLFNDTADKLYVANSESSSVSVIDTTGLTTLATPSVGTRPVALAIHPTTGAVTVANLGSNSRSTIATDESVTTSSLGYGFFSPFRAFFTASGVSLIPLLNGGVLSTSVTFSSSGTVTSLRHPTHAALNSTASKLYLSFRYNDRLWIYTIPALTLLERETGDEPGPIAIAEESGRVFVLNLKEETISVFSSADALIATISLPEGSRPCSIHAYEDAGGANDWILIGLCGTHSIGLVSVSTLAYLGALSL